MQHNKIIFLSMHFYTRIYKNKIPSALLKAWCKAYWPSIPCTYYYNHIIISILLITILL